MGRYDADKPYTWLSCLPDPVAGCVTSEQLKEVFANDERIVTTLEKDSFVTREDALLEIYRKLRPGDPPTVETSETLLDGLFFDRRRYDLFSVGRYKFNKKMDIWSRLSGQVLAEPIADPLTGEILAMPGETLTRAQAERALYEKFRRGEPLTRQEAEALLPSREDFVSLWRYLKGHTAHGPLEETAPRLARNIARACGQRETVMRTLVCLEVFDERGLIRLERTTDHLQIGLTAVDGKVDLEQSVIMRKLRSILEP